MPSGAIAAAHTAAASKFPVTSYEIDSANIKVRSSTHKKLSYFLFIDSGTNSIDSSTNRGVTNAAKQASDLSVGLSRHSESHDWNFQLKRFSLRINVKKGTGTIRTGKTLKRFGKLTLKLSSAGKAHRSCPSSTGFSTSRKIRLTGTPKFNSNSGKHGWGIVGAHRLTIKATLGVDYGTPKSDCGGRPQVSCPSLGTFLDAFASSTDLNASGLPGKTARLSAFRQVNLHSPKGASRSDVLAGTARPLTAKQDTDGTTSWLIRAKSHNASGSATVTAPQSPSTSTCGDTSSASYFGATWANGATKLALHGQIEPPISITGSHIDADAEVVSPLRA
jgi:hypothetical protein